jgi:hypothetical protein
MSSERKISIDLEEWECLIGLVTTQNKKMDDNHIEFMDHLKTMNSEHEKRYLKFYHISQNIFKELKKEISYLEIRFEILEERVKKLEEAKNAEPD